MNKEGQTRIETQIEAYKQHIIDMLEGGIPYPLDIPKGRLGWSGVNAFLSWYGGLSGRDRDSAIEAIGRIIESGTEDPAIIANIVKLATNLNLTQLEPQVKRLQESLVARIGFVREAIDGFFVPLELNRYVQEKAERGKLPPR